MEEDENMNRVPDSEEMKDSDGDGKSRLVNM